MGKDLHGNPVARGVGLTDRARRADHGLGVDNRTKIGASHDDPRDAPLEHELVRRPEQSLARMREVDMQSGWRANVGHVGDGPTQRLGRVGERPRAGIPCRERCRASPIRIDDRDDLAAGPPSRVRASAP